MNARTEYKGFTVEERTQGFGAADTKRYHVIERSKVKLDQTADGFNSLGYPTLNHAKGAITNYLKLADTPNNEFVKSVINLKSQPATKDDADRASVKLGAVSIPASEHAGVLSEAQAARNTDILVQQLTHAGLIKHGKAVVASQGYMSRNKREGKYLVARAA